MLSTDPLKLELCAGPFTLEHDFVDLRAAPEGSERGAYLFCIEPRGAPGFFLVSYVGQTTCHGGFKKRLPDELPYWFLDEESGTRRAFKARSELLRSDRVDLELFPLGIRKTIQKGATESEQLEQLRQEREALKPLYRVFLLPVKGCEESVSRPSGRGGLVSIAELLESTLFRRLHRKPADPVTHDFLCNKTPGNYNEEIPVTSWGNEPQIIGLNAAIPACLREAYERYNGGVRA